MVAEETAPDWAQESPPDWASESPPDWATPGWAANSLYIPVKGEEAPDWAKEPAVEQPSTLDLFKEPGKAFVRGVAGLKDLSGVQLQRAGMERLVRPEYAQDPLTAGITEGNLAAGANVLSAVEGYESDFTPAQLYGKSQELAAAELTRQQAAFDKQAEKLKSPETSYTLDDLTGRIVAEQGESTEDRINDAKDLLALGERLRSEAEATRKEYGKHPALENLSTEDALLNYPLTTFLSVTAEQLPNTIVTYGGAVLGAAVKRYGVSAFTAGFASYSMEGADIFSEGLDILIRKHGAVENIPSEDFGKLASLTDKYRIFNAALDTLPALNFAQRSAAKTIVVEKLFSIKGAKEVTKEGIKQFFLELPTELTQESAPISVGEEMGKVYTDQELRDRYISTAIGAGGIGLVTGSAKRAVEIVADSKSPTGSTPPPISEPSLQATEEDRTNNVIVEKITDATKPLDESIKTMEQAVELEVALAPIADPIYQKEDRAPVQRVPIQQDVAQEAEPPPDWATEPIEDIAVPTQIQVQQPQTPVISPVLATPEAPVATQQPTPPPTQGPAAPAVPVPVVAEKQQFRQEPGLRRGYTRVYHSGEKGEGKTGRWVSTNRQYASNYRDDLPLFYLDIPADDPRVNNLDYPEQSHAKGFTFNFELTPKEAAKLSVIERQQTAVQRAPIEPAKDTVIGKNAAGEQLYQRTNGDVYRMRFDRNDRPQGYPDFGGDLAKVETATQAIETPKFSITTNEANRGKTIKLEERIRVVHGSNVKITPVKLPDPVYQRGYAKDGTPTNHHTLAESLSKVFGKEIVWIKTDGGIRFNGVVVPGGSLSKYVFIDANSEHPTHTVLGHELSHHMEADAPAAYKELLRVVLPLLKGHELYRVMANIPSTERRSNIEKEMVGDLLGDAFADPAFAQEVFNRIGQENPSLLKQIANSINKWINTLLLKLGTKPRASQYVTDIKAVRAALAKAVSKYLDVQSNETTSTEGTDTPLFSRKAGNNRFNIPQETTAQEIKRKMQDEMGRFLTIQKELVAQGGVVETKHDVYLAKERATKRIAVQQDRFNDLVVEPLMKRVAKLKTTVEDLSVYLQALGANDRNNYIQSIRDDMPDNGSGWTREDAEKTIAHYKSFPRFNEFHKLALDIQRVTKLTQSLLVRGEVITQKDADTMSEKMGFYVPYRGVEIVNEAGERTGNKGYSGQRAYRKAYGRTSAPGENSVAHIFRDYHAAIVRVEDTVVAGYLRNLVEANPDPSLWEIDTPPKIPVMGKTPVKYLVKNGDTLIEKFYNLNDARVRSRKEQAANPSANIRLTKEGGEPVVVYKETAFDPKKEVRYLSNGESVRIQLHDPLAIAAYNRLNSTQFGVLLNTANELNKILRQMYTQKNPTYPIVNFSRDAQTAFLVATGEGGVVFATKMMAKVPGAFKAMLRNSRRKSAGAEYDRYIRLAENSGAFTAFAMLDDIEATELKLDALIAKYGGDSVVTAWKRGLAHNTTMLDKTGKAISNTAKLLIYKALENKVMMGIEHINHATENAYRLAAFMAYIEKHGGIDKAHPSVVAQASRISKNLTVNFNRTGEQKGWNAAYLFWKANIQGTQNIFRAATSTKHKGQVKALLVGLHVLGIMAGMSADDDDDSLMSDYDKDHNYIKHMKDWAITIPLAYGTGFFFTSGYVVGRLIKGKIKPMKAAVTLLGQFLGHFSPLGSPVHDGKTDVKDLLVMASPTAVKPFVVSGTNRTEFGSDLVPRYSDDDKRPDRSVMYRATKGSVYDKAANSAVLAWADISPETLKYATRFMTGGVGTFLADSYVTSSDIGTNKPVDVERMPFVKRIIKTKDAGEYRARFYKQLEEVKEKVGENEVKQRDVLGESTIPYWQKKMKRLRNEEDEARLAKDWSAVKAAENEQKALSNELNNDYWKYVYNYTPGQQ